MKPDALSNDEAIGVDLQPFCLFQYTYIYIYIYVYINNGGEGCSWTPWGDGNAPSTPRRICSCQELRPLRGTLALSWPLAPLGGNSVANAGQLQVPVRVITSRRLLVVTVCCRSKFVPMLPAIMSRLALQSHVGGAACHVGGAARAFSGAPWQSLRRRIYLGSRATSPLRCGRGVTTRRTRLTCFLPWGWPQVPTDIFGLFRHAQQDARTPHRHEA